jgi:hypothetical protein
LCIKEAFAEDVMLKDFLITSFMQWQKFLAKHYISMTAYSDKTQKAANIVKIISSF